MLRRWDWMLRGEVTGFDAARAHPGTYADLVDLAFDQALVTGVVVPLDEVHLGVAWSRFEDCTFRQTSRRLTSGGAAAQGCFGTRPSLYRRCTFSGVQFGLPGRFSLGSATFEDCVFDRCGWRSAFSYEADLVRCTFRGRMTSGAFGGTAPDSGRVNRIEDNDFSGATISGFGWRFDFPVSRQTWPTGFVPVQDM